MLDATPTVIERGDSIERWVITSPMRARPFDRLVQFILDNSLLLLAGTVAALVWANTAHASYEQVAHALHFVVNDVAMVFFFGLAAKEVYEAMLPGGPLSSPRQAAVPVLAAAGGMIGPALIYTGLALAGGRPELVRGWAIPCATDIAFSYMAARLVFPHYHPAIPFLLLLAIADDAFGLIILALFYPSGEVSLPRFALLMAPAVVLALALRYRRVRSFWPYVLGSGGLSWAALFLGGFHPALALVPIVPFMPHHAVAHDGPAPTHRGPGTSENGPGDSTLAAFEHWWRVPVQVILCFFGLVNAGVPFGSVGFGTWAVVAGLFFGKPVGIFAATVAAVAVGFERARGLDLRSVFVLGLLAGIGFTVALFFTTASFPQGGRILEEAKMGALLSFVAAPTGFVLGRALGVHRCQSGHGAA